MGGEIDNQTCGKSVVPEHAVALRRCGEPLARSAQLPAAEARLPRRMPQARSVAMLCAAMMAPSNQLLYWLVLAQQLAALTQAISSDMHEAAGEAQRAAQLAGAIREQLVPLCTVLEDQRSAADSAYARARKAVRLAEIAKHSPLSRHRPMASRRSSPTRRPRLCGSLGSARRIARRSPRRASPRQSHGHVAAPHPPPSARPRPFLTGQELASPQTTQLASHQQRTREDSVLVRRRARHVARAHDPRPAGLDELSPDHLPNVHL